MIINNLEKELPPSRRRNFRCNRPVKQLCCLDGYGPGCACTGMGFHIPVLFLLLLDQPLPHGFRIPMLSRAGLCSSGTTPGTGHRGSRTQGAGDAFCLPVPSSAVGADVPLREGRAEVAGRSPGARLLRSCGTGHKASLLILPAAPPSP